MIKMVTSSIFFVLALLVRAENSFAVADGELMIEGKSSANFSLAVNYGYRSTNVLCNDLNPWNSSHKTYKEITDFADESNQGFYKLAILPFNRLESGFCGWRLVSVSILVKAKSVKADQKVADAKFVIRKLDGFADEGVVPVPTPFEAYGHVSCRVRPYKVPVGYDKFTHFVECLAGNGEKVLFNQSIMNMKTTRKYNLDLYLY